jgi:hypothetical protein
LTGKQLLGAFAAIVIVFLFGKNYGESKSRPYDYECSQYVTALTGAMYAWRDAASGLADPAGYSDPLDRSVEERAQAGESLMKESERLDRECSIHPQDLGGPGDPADPGFPEPPTE